MLMELLSVDGYIAVNKALIKRLGLLPAVMLGELCSEYTYWQGRNEITDDGYFYSTRDNIENKTGMSAYQQREAMKILTDFNIINTVKRGTPCKTFYRINEEQLSNVLNIKMSKNLTSSSEKISHQEVKKFDTNKNRTNNLEKDYNKEFEEWWSTYPKKIGKKAALAAYKKINKETRAKLITAVEQQKTSKQWREDNGKYIPNPATWLNQGRWDDELEGMEVKKKTKLIQREDGTMEVVEI